MQKSAHQQLQVADLDHPHECLNAKMRPKQAVQTMVIFEISNSIDVVFNLVKKFSNFSSLWILVVSRPNRGRPEELTRFVTPGKSHHHTKRIIVE